MLTPSERRRGVHLYGWRNQHIYGAYGTYPSNPEIDHKLALSAFSGSAADYNTFMQSSGQKPVYIIDLAAVGKEMLLSGVIEPLDKVRLKPGGEWGRSYVLVRKNPSGHLYSRLV